MRILSYIGFFGFLLLSSCEEPFSLPDANTQIVISSFIQADKSPIVTVMVADGFGEIVHSDETDLSKVLITPEGEDQIEFELVSSTDTSSTFSSECIIEAGARYTLLIQTPGFTDLRSITEVPDIVSLRSPDDGDIGPGGGVLPKGEFFHLPIAFDDRIDQKNYYHMVVTIQNADDNLDKVDSKPAPYFLRPEPNDATPFKDRGLMFSDKTFSNDIFSSVVLVPKDFVATYEKPVVTVELRTVSIDYYNYHIQNSTPKSGNLPNHGSAGVIDNVAGGVGLFAGYSSTETSYVLEF